MVKPLVDLCSNAFGWLKKRKEKKETITSPMHI